MGKGYYLANQIVDEALAGIGDFNRKNYMEAAMYFMRGYRDFQLFDAFQEKEQWITINTSVNTVAMPDDLIRETEVGVNIRGEFFSFTRSDDMVSPSDPIDGQLFTARNEGDSIDRSPQAGYGAKGLNLEYYYKPDYNKRRIVLNRASVDTVRFADRTEVLVKFISNDVDDLDTTRIGMDAANMLISFIEWKMVAARPKDYPLGYADRKQAEYDRNESRYRILLLPNVDELLDTIYETSSQNIRF